MDHVQYALIGANEMQLRIVQALRGSEAVQAVAKLDLLPIRFIEAGLESGQLS
jgi:hypothetical protein